ncbi:MAG: phosphotriesterase family protein [Bryobacteraceae bacterium]
MIRRRDLLLAGALALRGHRVPGSILVHEHILVDFIGADQIHPGRYDPDKVFRVARPKLQELASFGCRRLLECTPQYLGRDPKLVARLAEATGIEIWTNTGIYGAARHRYVPAFARQETARQLATRWIREAREGVDSVHPRFIKTGVSGAPLDEVDRKLIRAAGLTSLETGLTISSHTDGGGPAGLEQLDILMDLGVRPEKFVWVHAQNEKDQAWHERLARAGAWVEFDGIREKTVDWHLDCVRRMARAGLLDRVLVSQDAGWYHVGEPEGGFYRGYTFIYTDFLPALESAWVNPLMTENPRAAFGA